MSHINKVFLDVILKRVGNATKPEITEEHCGFVARKGTINATYILRDIIERSLELQKDAYLCFIDHEKAFDIVCHDDLMSLLIRVNIDGKDRRNKPAVQETKSNSNA